MNQPADLSAGEHPQSPSLSVPLADTIDHALRRLGEAFAWLFVILMLVILLQVVLRRGFSAGQIALEELQWHLYGIGVLIGAVYAQAANTHVRVDIFHAHFSRAWQYRIEIIGLLVLLLPFLGLVLFHGLELVQEAWRISERSLAPAGLPWRWLIKSMIPLTTVLLIIAALNRIYRDLTLLRRCRREL
ncbi:TRAP transporter small permease subunit [Parathalassolituus penaei]|uniref:TRAP transporter small permease protein n=1 Tax=Parathalassolituus penaei TaxID=2997323 RepID=A0A9X3IUZ9_9GAMM|nr:TRAP transporter small permease subunit [Parathalassolituus penaei]MCY0967449.1 TRAP transporter small permease subunit [Parathalassolituus penaei]